MQKLKLNNKKGAGTFGLPTVIIVGVLGLFITMIVASVLIQQLTSTNLLGAAGTTVEANATANLRANISAGYNEINQQIPTIFKIAAVVLILAVLGILAFIGFKIAKSGMSGGSSNL